MCKLRSDSCLQQIFIEIAYEGVCDKCKSMNCQFYSNCVNDGTGARCVCPDSCANVFLRS